MVGGLEILPSSWLILSYWLVVTGTWLFYFSIWCWEQSSQLTNSNLFQRGSNHQPDEHRMEINGMLVGHCWFFDDVSMSLDDVWLFGWCLGRARNELKCFLSGLTFALHPPKRLWWFPLTIDWCSLRKGWTTNGSFGFGDVGWRVGGCLGDLELDLWKRKP